MKPSPVRPLGVLIQNDTVLVYQPILIKEFGRTAATLIQQIHYWIQKENIGKIHNGQRWMYSTQEKLADQLCISISTIKRHLSALAKLGVVQIQKLSNHKSNQTNYYTLNYIALSDLIKTQENSDIQGKKADSNAIKACTKSQQLKMSDSTDQNGPMVIHRITNIDLNKSEEQKNLESISSISNVYPQQVEQVAEHNLSFQDKNLEKGQERVKGDDTDIQPQVCLSSDPIKSDTVIKVSNKNQTNTTVQDMISIWNRILNDSSSQESKSKVILSKNLAKDLMGAYIHKFERDIDKFEHYCKLIASSDYLMGEEFVLSIGWALKFSVIDKIYKNHEFGVKKELVFIPSVQSLERDALYHIESIRAGEGDVCANIRNMLLKAYGPATYVSWFTKIMLSGNDKDHIQMKAESRFVEDHVVSRFGKMLGLCG